MRSLCGAPPALSYIGTTLEWDGVQWCRHCLHRNSCDGTSMGRCVDGSYIGRANITVHHRSFLQRTTQQAAWGTTWRSTEPPRKGRQYVFWIDTEHCWAWGESLWGGSEIQNTLIVLNIGKRNNVECAQIALVGTATMQRELTDMHVMELEPWCHARGFSWESRRSSMGARSRNLAGKMRIRLGDIEWPSEKAWSRFKERGQKNPVSPSRRRVPQSMKY